MCPSYQATMEEEHSPRGRSRLLFEMLDGHGDSAITDGWRSEAVLEALDLCLACKGCKSDCPVNVDIATYKAEFLSHHYKGGSAPVPTTRSVGCRRRRPAAAPPSRRSRQPARPCTRASPAGDHGGGPCAAGDPPLRRRVAAAVVAGRVRRRREARAGDALGRHLHRPVPPRSRQGRGEVLEHAGWEVVLPPPGLCCGLTWISTGQLDMAKKHFERRSPHSPIISTKAAWSSAWSRAVSPSSVPTRRSCLGDDLDAKRLRRPKRDAGRTAPRPHARAGSRRARRRPRDRPGALPPARRPWLGRRSAHSSTRRARRSSDSTPAAAGSPATSASRRAISRSPRPVPNRCSPRDPRVRPDDVVLADGFSCRTQIHELDSAGKEAIHLAVLLDQGQGGDAGDARQEERRWRRSRYASGFALALGALLAAVIRRRSKARLRQDLRRQARRADGLASDR